MCFYIETTNKEMKVAEKNITCYKIVKRASERAKKFKYRSIYQNHPYGLGIKVKAKLYGPLFHEISRGLHSYSSLKKMRTIRPKLLYPHDKIFLKCMIPKGANYYYNSTREEYVSNAIIPVKELKR